MDYNRIYEQLIVNARTKEQTLKENGGYYEVHHIVPRSMGGDDGPNNLVALSYREHFIAHWLLYKIHKTPEMYWAWSMMSCVSGGRENDSYRCTSTEFELIKRQRRDVIKQMAKNPQYDYIYHKFNSKKYFINVDTGEKVLVEKQDYEKYQQHPWKQLTEGRVKIVNIKTGETTSVERGDPLLNSEDWEFMKFLYTSDYHVFVVRHKQQRYRWIFKANDPEFKQTSNQWEVLSTRIVNTDTYENENVYLDDPRLNDKVHWASAYEKHHVFQNKYTGEYKKFYLSDPRRLEECWIGVNKNKVACVNRVTGEKAYKFEKDVVEPWHMIKKAVKNPDGSWPKKTCPYCHKTLVANYHYYKHHEENCEQNPANPNYKPINEEKRLTKGRTYYVNDRGEKLALLKDDPRVLSGEFKSIHQGKVNIQNIQTGETVWVERDDPKLKDPNWQTKFRKGTFPYRNKITGEIRLLETNNPLRQSDQWEPANKGVNAGISRKKQIVTCPYCGAAGNKNSGFSRWHMENCKYKPNVDN